MSADEKQPSRSGGPGSPLLYLLLGLAAATFVAAQFAPVVKISRLFFGRHDKTILGGTLELWQDGSKLLASLIFAFSIVFPLYKLGALAWLIFRPMASGERRRELERLELLGRWSMLDVFVIIILVGAAQLGILSGFEARYGILIFGASVLLSMAAAFVATHRAARSETGLVLFTGPPRFERPPLHVKVASVAALALFVTGITLPTMRVEKWFFWEDRFSILTGPWELFERGHEVLGLALLVFVVLLPLARFVSMAIRAFLDPASQNARKLSGWLLHLERWGMFDVFALALLIVTAKLSGSAKVLPQAGFWPLCAALALSFYLGRAFKALERPLDSSAGSATP